MLGGVILGSGKVVDLKTLKGLAQEYLALLPGSARVVKRGLIFMASVPSEAEGKRLMAGLDRMGCTQLQLQRMRIMLRKRWRVIGLSCPVEYNVAEIHRWLDSIDSVAREYGATVETWVPTDQPRAASGAIAGAVITVLGKIVAGTPPATLSNCVINTLPR